MTDLSILDEPVVQPAYEIWGQAFVAVWKAALVKGEGKVPFDPTIHKSMVYAIDLSIVPITEQNAKHVERSLIQNSKEWEMIQKSIKDLGAAPSEIDQKYVRIAFEPTGETYTNSNGETKNKTFIKFLKVFKNEAECIADYGATNMGDVAPATDDNAGVPAAGQKEFESAKKLLEASIRSALKSVSEPEEVKALVLVKVKASPVMAQFFNADSPELDDMIAAALKG
ncbi:MAG TPA: hypothetical protein PLU23_05650 [Anaerolineaceae bacterium]|nr:hypothetical protein [Anaerolineaceae bacterium]